MAYIDNVTNILQIQPDGLPTFVRLSQNENGRNLYFQLAGNEIDIPSNATVTISGTKPDGNVYSGTGSVSDNVVLIPEMLQMTAVAGTWDAKVKITSGGNTIATGRVRFIVDADTVDPDAVPSSSELEGLVAEAQQYAETARTEAYGSPLTASAAADMTDHTRVYVYTGSETGYTAGHWYYWDGSAWTDGGIYNSVAVNTDPTLTLTGVAADAKAAGDAIEAARVAIDDTLSNTGEAADAKVVGDELTELKSDLEELEPGLSDEAKIALLNCFQHVAWTDDHGQYYYDTLESALYAEQYPRITALFTPGTHIVYTDDTLDSLKPYLTVKYYENAESSGVIIPSTNYNLSGTLTEGSSTIIVSYNSTSTTFTISNVVDFYNIWMWEWSSSGGNLAKIHGSSEPGQTNLSMYPSGAALNSPYEIRRTYCTERGIAPYYEYSQTAVPTQYYPIPIPANANHVKVTTMPTGQFIYLTFYEFDGTKYDPRLGRTTWTEMSNGLFERGLSLGSGNQRFLIFNTKYDSAGESYPVEPTSMLIEFSEV